MLVSVCKGFKKSPHIEPFLEPIKRDHIWTSHPKLAQYCPLPSIPASTVAKGGQFGESNAPNLRASTFKARLPRYSFPWKNNVTWQGLNLKK